MLEENEKEQQSGFSVMSTEELYEINGGDQEVGQPKSAKSGYGTPTQGPNISTSLK